MAPLPPNGNGNQTTQTNTLPDPTNLRFSDIPSAIDIPASTFDSEVEVSLEELPDDPTELCTLLENEKASKNFWVIIALAYAKQNQIDHAIDILNKGLASVAHGATKEKLGLLGWICWLLMLKSRNAPRVAPDGGGGGGGEQQQPYAEATRTKDQYLQLATSTLNEASRLNPAFPPLFLARGVLSLLRASLYPPRPVRPGTVDTSERVESLRQALKCFDESSKAFGGRNVMAILGRARAQYLLGRYAEALEGYQSALVKMPGLTDPDPRVGIGCCLWQLGFKDQAKVAWERSLALNPDSKVANILLAVYFLYDSSRHSTTEPAFGSLYKLAMTQYTQKAFKLDKEYPMTCSLFGGYFLLRKSHSTVETLARKAIEQTDVMSIASDGWYLLARKMHYEGDTARAAEYYSRSDQARGGGEKGYLPAKVGMVQMQISNRDYDGGKFRLERIVQQSRNPEAMMLLGALHAEEVFAAQRSGLKEDKSAEARKAVSLFESVRALWKDGKTRISPDESVLVYLSRLYENVAPEKSMQCLVQLEEMQLGEVPEEERVDDTDEDKVSKTLLLREKYLPPQLLNNLGCFLYQSDKTPQAREMFQTALNACTRARESNNEETGTAGTDEVVDDALTTTISYNLGRTYESGNMPEEAKKVYQGLVDRHHDYTEANARLTYIALRQSPTDEGPRRMAKLYEVDSTNLEVRALFGWYLSKSKKRAANLAEDPEQRHHKHTLQYFDKHDRYALTGMGNVLLLTARDMRRGSEQEKEKRRKTYERAVEFFDKALQLDGKNAYAAQGIAIALVDDRKDYSAAVHVFSKIRDTLKDASVYLNLGHVFGELRQYTRSIEHYEMALNKDRARDAQILACLGRVWLLKGMQEKSIPSMKTALDYAKRARSVASELIHLEFNVAFVQTQIALLANSLPEAQKTLQDVQEAAAGHEEAIESFRGLAKAKNPPYPPASLEQRALMGQTISNKLERALQAQKEYEEKNAAKLRQARELREAETRRREEEVRKAQEVEQARKKRIAEERQQMVEEAARLAEQRAEEEKAREAAEYTTDSETGEQVKKKKASSKRKKKSKAAAEEAGGTDGESSRKAGTGEEGESETEAGAAPKKRRRVDRQAGGRGKAKSSSGGNNNRYKSDEVVMSSEDEDENDEDDGGQGRRGSRSGSEAEGGQETMATSAPAGGEGEEEEGEEQDAIRRRRANVSKLFDDDDEDENDEATARAGDGAGEEGDDLFGEDPEEETGKIGGEEEEEEEDTEMRDD